jgi:hypothetical protein
MNNGTPHPIMELVRNLEDKVRDKNNEIAALKEDVHKLELVYVKSVFFQPYGAILAGIFLGTVATSAVWYFLFLHRSM